MPDQNPAPETPETVTESVDATVPGTVPLPQSEELAETNAPDAGAEYVATLDPEKPVVEPEAETRVPMVDGKPLTAAIIQTNPAHYNPDAVPDDRALLSDEEKAEYERSRDFNQAAASLTIPMNPGAPEPPSAGLPEQPELPKFHGPRRAELPVEALTAYLQVMDGQPVVTVERNDTHAKAERTPDGEAVVITWNRGVSRQRRAQFLADGYEEKSKDELAKVEFDRKEIDRLEESQRKLEELRGSGHTDEHAIALAQRSTDQVVAAHKARIEAAEAVEGNAPSIPDVPESQSGTCRLPYGPGALIEIV